MAFTIPYFVGILAIILMVYLFWTNKTYRTVVIILSLISIALLVGGLIAFGGTG